MIRALISVVGTTEHAPLVKKW